jgi:class 3 adenylate cyclase
MDYKRGSVLSLNEMGSIYYMQGDYNNSLKYCKQSLKLAELINAFELQRDACNCIYLNYKDIDNKELALQYLQKLYLLDDSLNIKETVEALQKMEFQKRIAGDSLAQAEKDRLLRQAHQEEVRASEKLRNILFTVSVLVLIVAGGFYSRLRYVRKSKAIIEKEKDRSEHLLLNILPAEIAQELKEKGRAEARDFDRVSILFTDFKGFTEQSARISATDLVNEINTCFEAFDYIVEKYGIEKIKTIGDSYMAAGGLPVPKEDSVKNTVLAALEMQTFISKRKQELDARGLAGFEMRVGIHTGPVVAGIVGVKKFQYDIWGDTVNTASRMENSGEVAKVNISQSTYEILKGDSGFRFESRGKIKVKGKGEVEMYFVDKDQDTENNSNL